MSSEVQICNLAMQLLGGNPIVALTEDSVEAKACNRVFTHLRDTELRANAWNFARKRAQLPKLVAVPLFGFDNQFQLPSDFLRVWPTNEQNDWQVEGKVILTNDEAPLDLIYIYRVVDSEQFDLLFTEMLAGKIALATCEKITQSNTKKADAATYYDDAKKVAKKINAFEGPPLDAPEDEWITARL